MKARIFGLVLAAMVVLAIVVSPAPAAAQVDTRIVNIPFNFHLNNTMYPAGRYEIADAGQPHWYLLRSADFKVGQFLHANAIDAQREPSTAGLIFNRYGSSYFLAQVWLGERGGKLSKSKMESEVASQWQKGADNAVVLALKNK